MRRRLKIPDQEVLHSLLDYDPTTGHFTWKKSGNAAGSRWKTPWGEYRRISINGRNYWAHRIAWVFFYGTSIEGASIDHIDGNPSNNAIANLRIATSAQQRHNSRAVMGSRTGLKGVRAPRSAGARWEALIKVSGKTIRLGQFNTPEEAHAAYCQAAQFHFGEYARVSS